MVKQRRPWDERTREKIKVGRLMSLLHECAFGKRELTMTRLRAIEILLRKCMEAAGARPSCRDYPLRRGDRPQAVGIVADTSDWSAPGHVSPAAGLMDLRWVVKPDTD
jgi:hypothetical protein